MQETQRLRDVACQQVTTPVTCSAQRKSLYDAAISNLQISCNQLQKANGCDALRAEITTSSGAKEAASKMKNCDTASVCKQELDWAGMRDKCIEGIQNFGKEAMQKALEAGKKFVSGSKDAWKCDNNQGGLKQKLYDDYNQTVPPILQIHPPKGPWFERATCSEIMRNIIGTNQNLTDKYTRQMRSFLQKNPMAFNDLSKYSDPNLLAYKSWLDANGEKQTAELKARIEAIKNAFVSLPEFLKKFNVKVNCYNEPTKAEIACNAVAAAAATLVTGGLGSVGTKALMLMAKSSGSLSVARAVLAIQKLEKVEGNLAKAEEGSVKAEKLAVKAAKQKEVVLDQMQAMHEREMLAKMRGETGEFERRQLVKALGYTKGKTPEEADRMLQGVVDAHNFCSRSGFYDYSKACLKEKSRILQAAGFDIEQRRRLMAPGIAGKYADVPDVVGESMRRAAVYEFGRDLTLKQIQTLFQVAGKGSSPAIIEKLTAAGYSSLEIEKIVTGKLQSAVNKSKEIVLAEFKEAADTTAKAQASAAAPTAAPAAAPPAAAPVTPVSAAHAEAVAQIEAAAKTPLSDTQLNHMRSSVAGKYGTVPDNAVVSIRQGSVFLFKKDLGPEQVKAIWSVGGPGSAADKLKRLEEVGFSNDEAKKIVSGELNQAVPKAKNILLKDAATPKPAVATESHAPAAPSVATSESAIKRSHAKLAAELEQGGSKAQAAYEESRKAHLAEIKDKPESYRSSPSKVMDGVTGGLKPKEAADLLSDYLKDAKTSSAHFQQVIKEIDQRAASGAASNPSQAAFNRYKLEELKVEIMERHYESIYSEYNQLDTDRFMDEDPLGFKAFSEAKEKVSAMRNSREAARWPK